CPGAVSQVVIDHEIDKDGDAGGRATFYKLQLGQRGTALSVRRTVRRCKRICDINHSCNSRLRINKACFCQIKSLDGGFRIQRSQRSVCGVDWPDFAVETELAAARQIGR